uniref:Uncharacterized protein n=1 Tax=Lepeophtheirus salmonis TaxID=72036 RepID=A0A0K2TT47_LEPSM
MACISRILRPSNFASERILIFFSASSTCLTKTQQFARESWRYQLHLDSIKPLCTCPRRTYLKSHFVKRYSAWLNAVQVDYITAGNVSNVRIIL